MNKDCSVEFIGGPHDGRFGERLNISLDPSLFGPGTVGFIRSRACSDPASAYAVDVYRLKGDKAFFIHTTVQRTVQEGGLSNTPEHPQTPDTGEGAKSEKPSENLNKSGGSDGFS